MRRMSLALAIGISLLALMACDSAKTVQICKEVNGGKVVKMVDFVVAKQYKIAYSFTDGTSRFIWWESFPYPLDGALQLKSMQGQTFCWNEKVKDVKTK